MSHARHFTTRRGFIAASGFGGLGLYGLWAAYGAAPTPLSLLGLHNAPAPSAAPDHSAHGGHDPAPLSAPAPDSNAHTQHGAAPSGGPSPEEFMRQTQDFAQRFALPDGRIHPRHLAAIGSAATAISLAALAPADAHTGHETHGAPAAADPHAGHAMPPPPDPHAGHTVTAMAPDLSDPIEVLMTAGKWYYFPQSLKLDVGQAYRFRMMAVDIAHGASIQLGQGARMMRLPSGRVTEVLLTFPRAGTYLVMCTVYCGEGHQLMQGRIDVA